jgi:hypothetical protein
VDAGEKHWHGAAPATAMTHIALAGEQDGKFLGSQALESTLATLRKRMAGFEAQTELAASTDFPPGE